MIISQIGTKTNFVNLARRSGRELNIIYQVGFLGIVQGSRRTVHTGDGTVQETFTILGAPQVTLASGAFARNAQLPEVEKLQGLLTYATKLSAEGSQVDYVWFTEMAEDEAAQRRSVITSGVVVPADDEVVGVYNTSGKTVYTVTLTRLDKWEYGNVVTSPTGGWQVGSMGGLFEIPKEMSGRGQDSRISNIVVRGAQGGFFRKLWIGIWPNRVGYTSSGITHPDTWSPEVKWARGDATMHSEDTRIVHDESTVNNRRVECDFTSTTDWATRMSIDIHRINEVYQGYAPAARNTTILGEFRLIQRYRVRGNAGTLIGVRFGVGFGSYGKHISWSSPMWLRKIANAGGSAMWHNMDLGLVNIGNASWSPDVRSRFSMKGLRMYIQAARERTGAIDFDSAWLVPTHSYLYVDAGRDVRSNERVEVFVSPKGDAHGFIVESSAAEPPGKPLSSPRAISGEIPTISTENWVMPTESNSLMVVVSDRDDPYQKSPSGNFRIDMAVQKRAAVHSVEPSLGGTGSGLIGKGGGTTPIVSL